MKKRKREENNPSIFVKWRPKMVKKGQQTNLNNNNEKKSKAGEC
jgi:hypothetical protein